MFEKRALFESLFNQLTAMISEAESARKDSERESRAHKGAMASRYDTFKEEAQALARGHGKREMDLRQQLARVKSLLTEGHVLTQATTVQTGAIVHVRDLGKGKEFYYLIVNVGGGLELVADGISIHSLSFSTPLGRVILHKEEGDLVEFAIEGQ